MMSELSCHGVSDIPQNLGAADLEIFFSVGKPIIIRPSPICLDFVYWSSINLMLLAPQRGKFLSTFNETFLHGCSIGMVFQREDREFIDELYPLELYDQESLLDGSEIISLVVDVNPPDVELTGGVSFVVDCLGDAVCAGAV